MQNPITAKQMQIIENDCANPSNSHVNASGMVSINRVVRRPNLSQTMPLSKLPIGWTIKEQRAKKNCRNLKHVSKKLSKKEKRKIDCYKAKMTEQPLYVLFHLDSILNSFQLMH